MPTLDTISTVELIYKAFQENPTRITYSTKNLRKQFKAEEKEVKQAKELFKLYSKDYTVALTFGLQRRDLYDDYEETELWPGINTPQDKAHTIPASKFFDPLTGKTQFDFPKEEWEVKQKWVKGPEGSQLMVKKDISIDYKKEFTDFLQGYKPAQKPFSIKADDGILFVYTSDKHIGAETKEGNLLENDYDAQEFENRMINLAKEIRKVDQTYSLKEIVIVDLGDTVDGFNGKTTRGGHPLPQNMTNREVYKTFLQVHLDFIAGIVGACDCKNFSYITVGESNHGGDFEYVCNKSLEAILNLKYPQVKTFIGEKFLEHFIFGEHCFIFCHGKDIEDMKYPLPKNLDAKTELWIKSYVEQMNIEAKYIHFIKGDLHLASCEYSNNLRYKNCLSLYGSSKWVQTNFMKNTKGVCMDILTNNSITEHYLFL